MQRPLMISHLTHRESDGGYIQILGKPTQGQMESQPRVKQQVDLRSFEIPIVAQV